MPSKTTNPNQKRYEELASLGKNNWWRYALSLVLIVCGNVILSLPFVALLYLRSIDAEQLQQALRKQDSQQLESILYNAGRDVNLFGDYTNTLLTVATAATTFFLLWGAIRWIHRRSFLSLFTSHSAFDWKRVWTGAWVYGLILLAVVGTSVALQQASAQPISIAWNTLNWIHYGFFILILIPLLFLQVAAEELLFRGYIFQTAYLAAQNIQTKIAKKTLPTLFSLTLATLVSTTLFGLAHFTNIPFQAGILAALTYFVSALFFQIITIKDQRLELAIGVHFVNNFLAFAVIGSSLEGGKTSIFVDNAGATDFNTLAQLVATIIPFLLFYAIVFLVMPRLTKSQNKV